MPHPVSTSPIASLLKCQGLIIFGACAVVAITVVVIEEWPTIKQTYREVRARRRQRLAAAHQHSSFEYLSAEEEQPLAASGIHDGHQEMNMRSRNTTTTNTTETKSAVQILRPFSPTTSEQPSVVLFPDESQDVMMSDIEREPFPSQSPIFLEPSIHSDNPPVLIDQRSPTPELINPLDRPSSPDSLSNPFLDAEETPSDHPDPESTNNNEDNESIPLSRTTSHTLSFHGDNNSMSDWTEAFDSDHVTESEGPITDIDTDDDNFISDAESDASWARVRSSSGSRGGVFN